ncbi:MAG TPA: N-acetylmuramoyl-L-alanine amidase [Chitinophagales bacterium]|nr:N-acetylmuramoyl-L-alanine amidase [Chitinophagales bacterium]
MNKKQLFVLSCYMIGYSVLLAQDSASTYKINYYERKVSTYLDKQNALASFYTIDKSGIKIFASAHDKAVGKAEFRVSWDNLEFFKRYLKTCSYQEGINVYKNGNFENIVNCTIQERDTLSKNKSGIFYGYRIAIDAGHTAGNIESGIIEKKYLKFKSSPENGLKDSVAIAEGMLTYATAGLLKDKLEEEGAEVFLTRTFNGATAFGITFDEWLIRNYKKTIESWRASGRISEERKRWYLTKASKSEKFWLVFKDLELQKRAEIINDYKPDFTVIIHYNVDETNTGWTKPGTKNFCMAFIGGAFFKSDLSSTEKRFEFLRMLITNDIEASLHLSGAVVKNLQSNLLVKAAETKDATYLHNGCLYAGKAGVYCRNLQLTRNIHGPVIYGETLYQDNIGECILLGQESDKLKNARVKQAAEAYYKGIKEYVENWKE